MSLTESNYTTETPLDVIERQKNAKPVVITELPLQDAEMDQAEPPKQKRTRRAKPVAENGKAKADAPEPIYLLLAKDVIEQSRIAPAKLQEALADVVKNSSMELVRITVLKPQLSYTEE